MVREQVQRNKGLSMNRSAEHRLGSVAATVCQLAGAVPGAPIARFMGRGQVRRTRELPMPPGQVHGLSAGSPDKGLPTTARFA